MSSRILGLFRLTKGELCATICYCILASAVAKERRATIGDNFGLISGTPVGNWSTILLAFDLFAIHFDSLRTNFVALVSITGSIALTFATGQVTCTQLIVWDTTSAKVSAGFGFWCYYF